MEVGIIEGATHVAGASQGYIGLPICVTTEHCSVNGPETPVVKSAWQPTTDEIMRLFEGAPIILTIVGGRQPPVRLEVGAAPAKPEQADADR